jgi:hypothetical protein
MRFLLPISIVLISSACAEFEKWTDTTGRTAEMELQSVTKNGDTTTAQFRLKNGTTVTLDASKLSDADAKKLAEWKQMQDIIVMLGLSGYDEEGRLANEQNSPFASAKLNSYYFFQLKGSLYAGIKRDSLTVISSSITSVTKSLEEEKTITSRSPSNLKSSKYWQLQTNAEDCRVGDFHGKLSPLEESRHMTPGISFTVLYKNDDPISRATMDKSTLKAEITVVKVEGLADGEVTFEKSDVGEWGGGKNTEAKHREFGIVDLSLNQHYHMYHNPEDVEIILESSSPYAPSGIESWQLYSEGKPIKKMSEVTGSEITVKFKYWKGIKEVKVPFQKTSDARPKS